MDVDHATANAFVGLSFATDAQRQRVAYELVSVKAANAVAVGYRCQIHQIHQRIQLVQFLSLQWASAAENAKKVLNRISKLPPLAQGMIYSEILGKPKSEIA